MSGSRRFVHPLDKREQFAPVFGELQIQIFRLQQEIEDIRLLFFSDDDILLDACRRDDVLQIASGNEIVVTDLSVQAVQLRPGTGVGFVCL